MTDPRDFILIKVKWGFCVSVVLSVQRKTVQFSFDVVSEDVNLGDSTVESLGGWDVGDVSQTENVVIFCMLESSWVDIQQSGAVRETCL